LIKRGSRDSRTASSNLTRTRRIRSSANCTSVTAVDEAVHTPFLLLDKPCLSELRLDFRFPAFVLGPVLRWAFDRLAAICRSEAITPFPLPDYLISFIPSIAGIFQA
jgi:hypothetical protein